VSTRNEIGRRGALRLIGAAPLAVGFGLTGAGAARAAEQASRALRQAARGRPYQPKFFTPHEWDTVRVLVDLIIPRDERSGSATDAGVPEFMDFFLTDPLESDRSRENRQTAMRGGLAWIDAECRRRFGKDFVACAEGERTALLDEIAYSKGDEEDDEALRDPRGPRVRLRHGPHFFNSFRNLTASGFWSSKMGIEDLGYVGNTFVAEWQGPPAEVLRKLGLALLAAFLLGVGTAGAGGPGDWPIHDRTRPAPAAVDPGPAGPPAPAPADATVLFGGKDLSAWRTRKGGGPAGWKVENGYAEVVKGSGDIETVQGFGDCQLHVEWMSPSPAVGEDQDRGNSGVFLMGQYEVQVLDSYRSATYPDGQAAAIYGQYPPLVNASRPPGQWQTYDIAFRAPRFDADGKLLRPARLTVFHNGVLVQDAVELTGPTAHKARPPYKAHTAKLPIALQDHAHPVRFRNIWVRELAE
jgi:hypothetical protein